MIILAEIQAQAELLVSNGIQSSTRSTYSGPQKMFIQFCNQFGLNPLPATDNALLLFITHLHKKSLSISTVKVYISSIITMHNMCGLVPPNQKNPRIRLALRAIALKCPEPRQQSPVTFKVLLSMWQVIGNIPQFRCVKAAIALGFFGGLRGAEYLQSRFNKGPRLGQVSLGSGQSKTLTFQVTKSKTKPKGFSLTLSCSNHNICAVCCMQDYLQHRPLSADLSDSAPLFLYFDKELSKQKLCSIIKDLINAIGLSPAKYSLHSLRSGVATTAASCNFKDWELKLLGGWESNTYNTYTRSNKHTTRTFARRLTRQK